MIDVRTLLFANAVVFAVLAIAMILVWRGNPGFPGLASLARVHLAMMPGAALVGLPPGVVPGFVSVILGNALVVLSVAWLFEGIRELYHRPRDFRTRIALGAWAASLLFFQYVQPSLRGRILTTSLVALGFLGSAVWTARLGLRAPEERRPSLLLLGSLGLLGAVFAARSVHVAIGAGVTPLGADALTVALVTASLISGTGWTLGVMNLVYARLNAALSRDVTERKRYETALEQLVQVAAHELRSPLTSIVGTLKLVTAGSAFVSDTDRERLLEIARRNGERMSLLVDDLLDLERIESGEASFELETVDFERLLLQARDLCEGSAREAGVTIELALVPDVKGLADPQRLLQVVVNLLSNAIKFSPPGESVRVRMTRTGGSIRVEVADRGPGIPEELRPRIFQRFARGAPPQGETGARKGSGLGLAISKAIVEGLGGRIGFETADGGGTTFYFELAATGAAAEAAPVSRAALPGRP
ncbi:MAG TPA: HAMP domain-containing sensor histidine kinase [Thermoanaerobaculia bacterium]|nr:HAMP domain-containing sensor histidine kinase [Thermoanaerobaculia bacterium]